MPHYIVVTDVNQPGDGLDQIENYLSEMQEKYPDKTFNVTGLLRKSNKQWFPSDEANKNTQAFSEEYVTELMHTVLSVSPFGTTDVDVTNALESRRRDHLKIAAKHMQWLYTTASVTQENLDIWIDSIFEGELDLPGITNLTTEYESDPETTYMVEVILE